MSGEGKGGRTVPTTEACIAHLKSPTLEPVPSDSGMHFTALHTCWIPNLQRVLFLSLDPLSLLELLV